MYWDGMGGMMGLAWLYIVLRVVGFLLFILLVVWLFRRRGQRPWHYGQRPSRAREILDERYARGEIDATEYEERKRRLDDEQT